MTLDLFMNILPQLLNSVIVFQTFLDPKREMLFITSNSHNWVWKLISKIDCTICFLGMCSCYNYLYFKLVFFFVKLLLLLKWLDSTYCCFIVESYSAPYVSASLLGIKITWEEGNIKQNLILVILSAQMCLFYIPGATITGKHCRVCR